MNFDRHITGNFGEDHPDNVPTDEDRRAADDAFMRGYDRWIEQRSKRERNEDND